jgi:hypothetical protein
LGKVARLAQEYAAFTTQSAIIFYARPRCGHFFISSYPITLNVQEQTGNRLVKLILIGSNNPYRLFLMLLQYFFCFYVFDNDR